MGKVSFRDFIKNNIVILDGATGTELQKGYAFRGFSRKVGTGKS